MTHKHSRLKTTLSVALAAVIISSSAVTAISVNAADNQSGTAITYSFSGDNADKAGYAQGKITFTAQENGTYYLYWADDEKALDGYYEIFKATITDDKKSAEFTFENQTAIPADATRIIAVQYLEPATPDEAEQGAEESTAIPVVYCSYDIPTEKQLPYKSTDAKYTFNSYSDIHIDDKANTGGYKYADSHWKKALAYSAAKNVDFVITSGDHVNNKSKGSANEWDRYQKILSESDYVNPIYEANGNHELKEGIEQGNNAFINATGLDSTEATLNSGKPYYYVKEKNTGDLFIFMALEGGGAPNQADEFTDEQLNWVAGLISENYGKCNIYIIQHALAKGYGAGDFNNKPAYGGAITDYFVSTVKFKNLMQKYPDLIWISGHTHEAFALGNNYSNENGTSCNMIHNSSVGCPTTVGPTKSTLLYKHKEESTEGYYVQTFGEEIIFSGADLHTQKIYPAYSYIVEGSRNSDPQATNATLDATSLPPETGGTLDPKLETNRYYFVNTLDWVAVDCYAWTGSQTNNWPGYACTFLEKNEDGFDVYYVDIPTKYTTVIFNNTNRGAQTVDISLKTAGENNMFTPNELNSSGKATVTKSVYGNQQTTTEPPETTEPTTAPIEEVLLGDANSDGKVNINDATAIQKFAAFLGEVDEKAADVNADSKINIKDATEIQKFAAGIITEFVNQDKPEPVKTGAVSSDVNLQADVDAAKTVLEENYKLSSYDQYQSLKKAYYQCKSLDLTAVDAETAKSLSKQLADATDSLKAISNVVAAK